MYLFIMHSIRTLSIYPLQINDCPVGLLLLGVPGVYTCTAHLLWDKPLPVCVRDPFCPLGWLRGSGARLNGSCYRMLPDLTNILVAEEMCRLENENSTLVVLDAGDDEISFLKDHVATRNMGVLRYWIGLNEKFVKGEWLTPCTLQRSFSGSFL